MNNIHDWCVSRQLWWGHRIPAWTCNNEACKEIVVAREAPAKCTKCGGAKLEQVSDVLDTWFSSGLLPFTTLGWPEKTRDQAVFYPTTLLITAYEILFFWVARMVMFGCHFMQGHEQDVAIKKASGWADKKNDSVPFRQVYIHALVRDAERQKMSKTKGNVVDPLDVIERFGTDATRFTLAAMAAPGTDIAFNESRTDGYRAFANKIWNAARFMFMNVDRIEPGLRPATGEGGCLHMGVAGFKASTLEDQWILSRFNRVAADVNDALQTYRFHEAANRIYDFFWGEFCDWYLELIKPRLNFEEGADTTAARAACANLVNLFDASLRLLHPVMPFITEEIWQAMHEGTPPLKSIAFAAYPQADEKQFDLAAETEMAILQDLIVSVRNLRAELKVEPKFKVPVEVFAPEPEVHRMIEQNSGAVRRLANAENLTFAETSLANRPGARSTSRFDVHVVYERKIDVAAECERLKKELDKLEKEWANNQKQLGNEQFVTKAPSHVVEGLRKRAAELGVLLEKTKSKLKELGC
jgi:valyl-tRNA synthetase